MRVTYIATSFGFYAEYRSLSSARARAPAICGLIISNHIMPPRWNLSGVAESSSVCGPGFGHGSVPVLATITGMSPSQLVATDPCLSVYSARRKYSLALLDRYQSRRRWVRLWSWLPRFDS